MRQGRKADWHWKGCFHLGESGALAALEMRGMRQKRKTDWYWMRCSRLGESGTIAEL